MKELSIEEKAKRYDEAIEIINDYYQKTRYSSLSCASNDIEVLEKAFPELKESGNIRIIKAIKYGLDHVFTNNTTVFEVTKEQCLAWLEKQGEHAKFCDSIQVGDKVTRNEDGVLVNLSQLKRVAKKYEKQGEQKPAICDRKIHQGDKNNPYDMSMSEAEAYTSKRGFDIPWNDCDVFVDERYITQTVGNILRWADDNPKQKPAWSEEDEEILEDIRFNFEYNKEKMTDALVEQYNRFFDKIKSLQPQPKSDWSEEDEKKIRALLSICDVYSTKTSFYPKENKDIEILKDWLNSLKDRVQLQLKQEWSEEDEDILNTIINHFKVDIECTDEDDTVRWLKSLKKRYTWKPSDEQIKALRRMKAAIAGEGEIYKPLNLLYEDLLKLREE